MPSGFSMGYALTSTDFLLPVSCTELGDKIASLSDSVRVLDTCIHVSETRTLVSARETLRDPWGRSPEAPPSPRATCVQGVQPRRCDRYGSPHRTAHRVGHESSDSCVRSRGDR